MPKKKEKGKEYCQIETCQLSINAYSVVDEIGKDEYDEEYSLAVSGCNVDNIISIKMEPCFESEPHFEVEITAETAKIIIRTMQNIIDEQEL